MKLFLSLILLTTTVSFAQSSSYEGGGSNYVMWSIGQYGDNNPGVWGDPVNGVRPLVALYHESPETVAKTLYAMKLSGQKKLALVLWYTTWNGPIDDCRFMHTIVLRPQGVCPQVYDNLERILAAAYVNGFDEIYIRFAAQGNSDPLSWTAWHQDRYDQFWQFVEETRAVVEMALGDAIHIKRRYDLCLECGGFSKGQSERFVKESWRRYVSTYSNRDSTLASIIYNKDRMNNLFKWVKSVKDQYFRNLTNDQVYPIEYSVDIYKRSGLQKDLRAAYLQSLASGLGRPIVLLETYYDDCGTAKEIQKALKQGVNLRAVYQWPKRYGTNTHMQLASPMDFTKYSQVNNVANLNCTN